MANLTSVTRLRDALAQVRAREGWLEVLAEVPPAGTGWQRCADLLADPASLAAIVEAGADLLEPTASPAVRRHVAAALLLGDWSWALATAGAGCLGAGGVVPCLDPEEVFLRFAGGRCTGVAATCAEYEDDGDLDALLRARLAEALGPLHEALRVAGLLRAGSRTTWGAAGDAVALALLRTGEGLSAAECDALLALGERVLAGAPRAWGEAGWQRLVDARGAQRVTRQRASCCFWYRLPAQEACLTCPRVGDAERAARIAALT